MSGRPNQNEAEHRLRERDRQRDNREQQIFQILRDHIRIRDLPEGSHPALLRIAGGRLRISPEIVVPHGQPISPNLSRIMQSLAGGAAGGAGAGGSSSSSAAVATKRKCPSFGTENVEAWACTEIEQETFSFLWTLKNFSSFTSTTTPTASASVSAANTNLATDEVKSPVFKGGPQSLWQLKINAKKKIDEVDYLSVHLILTSFGDGDNSPGRKIKVRFQITLLDGDGRPGKQAGSQTMNVCEFKKNSVWGYDKFMLASDILNQNRRLLEDNSLKIHCRIWIEGDLKHKTGSGGALDKVSEDELKVKRLRGLSDDLGKLLCSSEMADVAITTPKYTFMAHRVILAARSPVFNRMFEIDMVESKTCSVDITDFDKEVVQGMLEYMYTGHTEFLFEKAPELMQIAEKYDLGGLKEDCEIEIANNLTVENAAEVLVLAHLHNAAVLKPAVISFINRNKDAVKKTKTFQDVAQANSQVFVDLYLSQE